MSTPASLDRRVAGLEAVLRDLLATREQGDTPETTVPNYLTVRADGTVGASFTGIVNAQGLILPASPNTSPSDASRIEWTRTSDGAVLADIQTLDWQSAGRGYLALRSTSTAAAPLNSSTAILQALATAFSGGDGSGGSATLQATGNEIAGGNRITAQASAPNTSTLSRIVIADDGMSDFLQLGATAAKFRVWGPFSFQVAGPVASGADANSGAQANSTGGLAGKLALGMLSDSGASGWSHQFSWRGALGINTQTFVFHNAGPNAGSFTFTYVVITIT